jgi:hypothetical protein
MSGETPTTPPPVSDPGFWRDLYARGQDGWDLGHPSPSLEAHLARTPPPRGRVAVPGCGRGHDARLWAGSGFEVWGFDFLAEPLAAARTLAEREDLTVTFEQRDIFGLAADYSGFFDGVWEYTCYCAIDPARRPEYAALTARLLRPGGWLLACFFPMTPDGPVTAGSADSPLVPAARPGPPFPVVEAEVRRLFEPHFELVETYVPAASPEARQGREWMVLARRRE